MTAKERLLSIKKTIAEYSSREIKILINLFILVAAVLIFSYVAKEVISGSTQHFDDWALNLLRSNENVKVPIGPAWLTLLLTDITALGGATVIFILTLLVVLYLYFQKNYELMCLVLFASVGGALLSIGLKELFSRERPPIIYHLLTVKSLSFPSGHAMMSSVIYLTLGAMLAKIQTIKNLKIYVLISSITLVFLIGISRIYLGVHYPSDVFAGWAVGLAWASFCWLTAQYFERKKRAKNKN